MALPSLPRGAPLPKLLGPILAGIAGLGLLAVAASQFQQIRGLERTLRQSRQQAQQLEAKNLELAQHLAGLESEKKSLDERVGALRAQLTTATANLDQSRQELDGLRDRFDALEESYAKRGLQISSLTAERDELREETARLDQEKAELERSLVRMRERLTLLDRDYRQMADRVKSLEAAPRADVAVVASAGPLPSGNGGQGAAFILPTMLPGVVELPPIIVRKDQAGLPVSVRGRLVEVNDAHGFVVVDKGSTDGVRPGMTLDIVRGTSTVGQVQVVRVRPHLAACDVVRSRTSGPLQAGDSAVQAKP
jgi:hypothetical protein